MKVLLVTRYFPPSGGGGVQRPLKLATHLPALGIETHVLAPDDPKWINRDDDLRPPTQAFVHRARYIGPAARMPSDELHGRSGLDLAVRKAGLFSRRLLVPDAHVTWALTAVPAALRIVRDAGIDVVLTTSPPSSIHLIGAAVKARRGIHWVADLRDPMIADPDRATAGLPGRLKERSQYPVLGRVARSADAIVAVTEAIVEEVRSFDPRGPVVIIPNGCDFDDFAGLEYRRAERFRITYTGSFFAHRDPRPFLRAVAESELDLVARFVGKLRPADHEWAVGLGLGDRLELLPYVPRRRALELQRDSDALLLLVADAGGRGKVAPSGKIFDYLAAGRPILAAVPPDGAAADLIRETNAGLVVRPDDVDGIREALGDLHGRWQDGGLGNGELTLSPELRQRFSRRKRAEELAELLWSLD